MLSVTFWKLLSNWKPSIVFHACVVKVGQTVGELLRLYVPEHRDRLRAGASSLILRRRYKSTKTAYLFSSFKPKKNSRLKISLLRRLPFKIYMSLAFRRLLSLALHLLLCLFHLEVPLDLFLLQCHT